jgi:hypothetical protein
VTPRYRRFALASRTATRITRWNAWGREPALEPEADVLAQPGWHGESETDDQDRRRVLAEDRERRDRIADITANVIEIAKTNQRPLRPIARG